MRLRKNHPSAHALSFRFLLEGVREAGHPGRLADASGPGTQLFGPCQTRR